MKYLFILFIAFSYSLISFGQAPNKISYQMVVRDAENSLVVNSAIGMQISILQETINGSSVYVETQSPRTNTNGLVSIEIGSGSVVSGDFNGIDWSSGLYFILSEIDINGGSDYTISGTSQLLSVPYALHANTADELLGDLNSESLLKAIPDMDIDVNDDFDGDYHSLKNSPDLSSFATKDMNHQNLTNLGDPINDNDAVNKAYVTVRVSLTGDTLFMGHQFVIISGISGNNGGTSGEDPGDNVFTDSRDSYSYKTVQLGTQLWMAENLAYLPSVSPPSQQSGTDPYYYVYGSLESDVTAVIGTSKYQKYGVLYNWTASLNACPSGWHLPSKAEWETLSDYLIDNGYGADGSGDDIGKAMAATTDWNYALSPNIGFDLTTNNSSGFTALPGGNQNAGGTFYGLGIGGQWWSSLEHETLTDEAWLMYLNYDSYHMGINHNSKVYGHSIRCLKD